MTALARVNFLLTVFLSTCLLTSGVKAEPVVVKPGELLGGDTGYGENRFGKWVAAADGLLLVGQGVNGKGEIAFAFKSDSGNEKSVYMFPGGADSKFPANFAGSGALSDSFVIIGADTSYLSGSVTVRARDSNENFDIRSPATGAGFGSAIAADGEIALIGADTEDDTGAAYLYNLTSRKQLHKLTAEGLTKFAQFGGAVALSPKYAVIGAPDHNERNGAAYVFDRATGKLLHQLKPKENQGATEFGRALAISDGRILVGAPSGDRGKLHIFEAKSGIETGSLFVSDNKLSGDEFGCALAISGDYAIVGASYEGAVYFVELKTLKVVNKMSDKKIGLGWAVAAEGERVYLGAPLTADKAGTVLIVTDWKTPGPKSKPTADPVAAEAPSAPEPTWENDRRTWTDKTGKFAVEAMYDSYVGGGVIRLRKEDGSTIDVPMSKLSNADRLYAVELSKEERKAVRK